MDFQNLKEEVIVLCALKSLKVSNKLVNNPLSTPEQNNFVLKINVK